MTRLFIALSISDDIKEQIDGFRKQAYSGRFFFKWEPRGKFHITLKFIGDVSDELVPHIVDELSFLEKYPGLVCSLDKFGFFFNNNIPRILWVGFKTEPEIYSIVNELNLSLEKFSISKEKKKFKSHITILRLMGHPGESFIESFRKFNFPDNSFTADEIVLYKSELFAAGSRYTEIKKYKLK